MSHLNLQFETKHGFAMVAKGDVVSIEDIDERTSAITVRHPGNQVFKHYSTEKAIDIYERLNKLPEEQPQFVERRKIANANAVRAVK
ncbi:DUF4265 domain-containing protein [Pseudemcibacter aquimaris]|uniref:DUF4265 domain-containing protein n=1 Tax=Pseudemcibacter aquimaris TaxID=2857064 RepID=UPI0020121D08|nr:DUF4265 domain-containing protein [Pseudemcibacter aquimaris]MCC3859783.1 DUF4265 domain-containing protein [Pseudemcibacter aquimaris]WDU60177.1 DUF4265 domain-containing protein [Pseudemcibacter aquimaris]